jgi:hypothetical protein
MRILVALPVLAFAAVAAVPSGDGPTHSTRPAATVGSAADAHVVGCRERAEPVGPRASQQEEREARRASIILPALTLWGSPQCGRLLLQPR